MVNLGSEGKVRRFGDTHCIVCGGRVTKGRLYTCSMRCQNRRSKAFELQIRRNRERYRLKTVKVKGIRGAFKSLFGGS